MRYRDAACVLYAALLAVPCAAQEAAQPPAADQPALIAPPSWAFNDLACAAQLEPEKAEARTTAAIRVIGSQDTGIRDLLGPGDTLVVSGGSAAGLQPGQRFFVRRRVTILGSSRDLPATIHTAGWVQIVGVDTSLATATIVHACDGFLPDDYLEPYAAPTIAARPIPGTTPHYENMGHVMTGGMGMTTFGSGQVLTIDRGSNAGIIVGQRFLVFRDKRDLRIGVTGKSDVFETMSGRLPLVEIGQILVVAVRPEDSSAQVVLAKDAISTGDLIAPIR